MYQVLGWATITSIAVTRPLMPAGPMLRGFQPLRLSMETRCAEAIKNKAERTNVQIAFMQ